VGEGDIPCATWAERFAGRDYADIPNLWLGRNARLSKPITPLIANLDELPYADRELFDYDAILAANDGWVDLIAGRGCPYNCSYCCNPGLKKRYGGLGKYVRFRGVEHVVGEIRALRERYKIKIINFQDDTFTLDRDWALAFCRAYAAEFEYPYWINTPLSASWAMKSWLRRWPIPIAPVSAWGGRKLATKRCAPMCSNGGCPTKRSLTLSVWCVA
jgi:hypothetical protein